jgi:hypothetical protein
VFHLHPAADGAYPAVQQRGYSTTSSMVDTFGGAGGESKARLFEVYCLS